MAISQAESLAANVSDSPPTDLLAAARRRRVKAIYFRPMEIEAGLSVDEHGFTIFVGAPLERAPHWQKLFDADGTGRLLPHAVRSRLRFTIAHEIAHTFFYDLSDFRPLFEVKLSISLDALERACHAGAGALLLPEVFLKKQLFEYDLLSPDDLSVIASKCMISREALVIRLSMLANEYRPVGVVLLVERRGNHHNIVGSSVHYSFSHLFNFRRDAALSQFVSDSRLSIFGGKQHSVKVGRFLFTVEEGAVSRSTSRFFASMSPL